MMVRRLFVSLLIIAAAKCVSAVDSASPPIIIFDTDMGSDVDDAGALAVLHKLADHGEAEIAGVIFSSGKNKYGIGVCDAINTWYGRGNLPLGQYKGNDVGDPMNHYSEQIAKATDVYKHRLIDNGPELVATYKRILRKQPDDAVTIVTVGHPHGLAYLLRDAEAAKLIDAKVKRWVAMAYSGANPINDWNLGTNGAEKYLREILTKWPKDLYVSSAGSEVITGNVRLPLTPKNNPVREAYRLWNNAIETGRMSWDQIAVLFAVRPGYFEIEDGGSLDQAPDLKVFWNESRTNPKHHRVRPKVGNKEMASIIENLMSEPPGSRTSRPGGSK